MTLYEFADVINKEIRYLRYPNQKGRFLCSFQDCEVKGEGVLYGYYGTGKSEKESAIDYISQITGQVIVFNSFTDRRQEFTVPDNIKFE